MYNFIPLAYAAAAAADVTDQSPTCSDRVSIVYNRKLSNCITSRTTPAKLVIISSMIDNQRRDSCPRHLRSGRSTSNSSGSLSSRYIHMSPVVQPVLIRLSRTSTHDVVQFPARHVAAAVGNSFRAVEMSQSRSTLEQISASPLCIHIVKLDTAG